MPRVDVVADCSTAKVGVSGRGTGTAVLAVPRAWHRPGSALCPQSAVGAAHQTLRVGRALRRARELLARGLHWVM